MFIKTNMTTTPTKEEIEKSCAAADELGCSTKLKWGAGIGWTMCICCTLIMLVIIIVMTMRHKTAIRDALTNARTRVVDYASHN